MRIVPIGSAASDMKARLVNATLASKSSNPVQKRPPAITITGVQAYPSDAFVLSVLLSFGTHPK